MSLDKTWYEKADSKYPISKAIGEVSLQFMHNEQMRAYYNGLNDFQQRVLEMLKANHLDILKDEQITEFDFLRMQAISEVYGDLIALVTELKAENNESRARATEYDTFIKGNNKVSTGS